MEKPQSPPRKISLEKVVTTSFLMNISDLIVNTTIGVLSGSVTMFAQALEGGADLISSGLILIGVKRSKQPADKLHPYGYGRELYFWTFLSGLVIFSITATLSIFWGIQRFLHPEPIDNLGLTYFALTLALFTNGYSLSLSYKRLLGQKKVTDLWRIFQHSALIETKTTFVIDLMGTIASILGLVSLLIYGFSGDYRFDGIGAIATGVILGFFALVLLRGAKALLVGQSASPEIEAKIRDAALAFRHVQDVLDLRTILLGTNRILVNMELHIQDKLTTDEIELLIDTIEEEIRDQVPSAEHIQIELETPDV